MALLAVLVALGASAGSASSSQAATGRLAVLGSDDTSCGYSAVPPANPFLCGSATRLWLTHDDGTGVRTLAYCPRSFTAYPCRLGRPALSPDGRQVAVGRDDHLLLFDVRSGAARTLNAPAPANGDNPVWSPDGRRLATIGPDGIYVLRPDGTGLLKVSPPAEGNLPATRPRWFRRDGHLQLAYVLQHNIAVTDATGSRTRLVTRSGAVESFTVTANGRIVYIDKTPVYRNHLLTGAARLLSVDSRSPHPHTIPGTPSGDPPMFSPAGPTFSPDGRHLLYISATRTGQNIVVQGWPRGKHRVTLANDAAHNFGQASATWSPDGRSIIIAQAKAFIRVRFTGSHATPVLSGTPLLSGTQPSSVPGGLYDRDTDPTGAGSNGYDLSSPSWSQTGHPSTTG